MLTRWLLVLLVAIGLGVAALELSTCLAVEPGGQLTGAAEPELPSGSETEAHEASALPRFTQ